MVSGENAAKKLWMVVCRRTLKIKKRKQVKAETWIKWWKLRKEKMLHRVQGGVETR